MNRPLNIHRIFLVEDPFLRAVRKVRKCRIVGVNANVNQRNEGIALKLFLSRYLRLTKNMNKSIELARLTSFFMFH